MDIRAAVPEDLPGIFAIYDREVLHGTATFETTPKSASERTDWFRAHAGRYPLIVAAEAGSVLGWAGLWPWSPRPAYARSAENSVYVDSGARGRGLGRTLLDALILRAREAGICVVIARIVEGNPASLRLHESAGFRTIGVMRRVGEKFARVLDVRLMELHLDLPESS